MLNRREGLKAALALIGVAASRRAMAAPGPAVVPVAEHRNRFFLDVGVNRGAGYRFVLDTGTNTHIISTRLVEQLRLPKVDRRMVRGYEGVNQESVVGIQRLTVGGVDLGRANAVVWGANRLEDHDGLIGYPFLYPDAVLDLAAGRIALGAGPPADSVEVAAEVGRDQTVLLGGVPGAEGRFVFDTGSQFLTISSGYHHRVSTSEAYRAAAKLVYRAADGSTRTGAFRPDGLAFGELRIRKPVVRIGAADGSEGVFLDVDGLFGVNVIRPYIWALDQAGGGLEAAPGGPEQLGYYGSGLALSTAGGTATISAVVENGPAHEAGVRPGQPVLALGGWPPADWDRSFLRAHALQDGPGALVLEIIDRGERRTVELASRRLL